MSQRRVATTRAGVILNSGAFIALEKRDPVMTHLVERFAREATPAVFCGRSGSER